MGLMPSLSEIYTVVNVRDGSSEHGLLPQSALQDRPDGGLERVRVLQPAKGHGCSFVSEPDTTIALNSVAVLNL